ncbi:MAG TPA: PQQ-binding-like beta-propeller repeat protein, partial [Dehalococcoidia bacterium]|nr:PQQ-binding-like beta-propeller repeat protein [Dehalococcoidia bacterium]
NREWTFVAGGYLRSSPALGDNILYIGSEDSNLYAVDATDGKKLWDFRTGDKITSSPALIDGVLYIGSHDGKVYAIE